MIGLVLLLGAVQASGASAPVVIVMPPGYEAQTDASAKAAGGLLVAMLGNSINKEGGKQIARFYADLQDPTWADRVARVFSCIGAEQVSADCPPAKLYSTSSEEAERQVREAGAKRILLVRFQPMKTDFRIRMRAIVNDARVIEGGVVPERVFTAVYEARVPAELEARAKKDPAALQAWWSEGSPSRLAREVDQGIEELRQILTLLDREVPANNSAPKGWAGLPATDALLKSGRIKCGGGGCKKHHVVRDAPERLWLTTEYAQGDFVYGWSVVSMDDNTAKRYSNIMLNVQTTSQ